MAEPRSEFEVARELKRVRRLLAEYRAIPDGNEEILNILYGAQQALIWMLRRGHSPSELEAIIRQVTEELDHG